MQILLDTNFIIAAVKQKIDIQEQINICTSKQVEWLIPQDVLNELGNLKNNPHASLSDSRAASLSFQILKTLNPTIIRLPTKNPNIDIKIVNYILNKPIVLATLDKNLKSRVDNEILTIKGRKSLRLL